MLLALVMVPFSQGIQLSDLYTTMTRTEADDCLTKDYMYRVLNDLTVRRIWNLDDNRKLTIDFDPTKNKLLCIFVDYKKAVSEEKGTKDLLEITHAKKAKWKKLSKSRAEKYDVSPNAKAVKAGKKAYAFMELNGAGKCFRISVYTYIPKENRRHLADINTTSYGMTAMGSNAGASAGKILLKEEERRFNTPNKTDLAASVAAARAAAAEEADAAADEEDDDDILEGDDDEEEEEATATASDDKAVAKKPKSKKKKVQPKGDRQEDVDNLMAKLGLDKLEPIHYIVGVVGIVLLFTIIGIIRRRIEAKRLAAKAEEMRNMSVKDVLRSRIGSK